MFLYGTFPVLLLSFPPLSPAVTLAEVLGQAGEAVQLLAAPTDDLARDEEDNTVLSPELTLQILKRQHLRREPVSEKLVVLY